MSAPLRAAGLLALLAAVACSGGDGTPAPPPAPPVDAPTAAAPDAPRPPDPPDTASPPDTARPPATAQVDDRWTAGVTRRERQLSGVAVLTAFRLARNDTFDRAVFEFEDDLPSYHIEYVDRPIYQCGSGDVVELAGDGWLTIRLDPAIAHTEEGRPTIEQRSGTPRLPTVVEYRLICDFEGQVEWILGVASPNRYRVLELQAPTRLVVDIQH